MSFGAAWWCATHSSKRKTKLITYQSGDNRSMIYYLMVRKTDRCLVKDVKVISSVSLSIEWLLWKLKDEETARLFTHEMSAKNDEVTKADDIQKKWLLMKETWLKGSKQVCGMTKGPI